MPPMSVFACSILVLACSLPAFAEWRPAKGPLLTRWAKDVSPERVHPEHPRPQLVRKEWLGLNGLWDYAIRPRDEARPASFEGQILVPFPLESALSGVMRRAGDASHLWYRRSFQVPASWAGKRVLLHFGAADWEARVWVNGKEAGSHRGGYDPFTLEVTPHLAASGENELVVSIWDPTDRSTQPRGKQVQDPRGIWYTPTTGIWQTVWLEAVPLASVGALKMVTDVETGTLRLEVDLRGEAKGKLALRAEAFEGLEGGTPVAEASGPAAIAPSLVASALELKVPGAKPWSPDSPTLYGLKVSLLEDGKAIDEVKSYFGIREVAIGKDSSGITRMLLNGKFLFQLGPLDQGFWPDGLYTAPTDEALRYDIEVTRDLGFNMARKHVKVEPDRWYYWCDVLGLLVWQDMPSGDRYIGGNDPDITRSPESARQFELELKGIIDALRNHPSIILWVPFNEGWGQFDTRRITELIRAHDPTRLVDSASGWTDRGTGDVHDIHAYPGPGSPDPEPARAAVLGEFGGLGLPLKGHTWQDEKNWGYRSFATREELTAAYVSLLASLRPLIASPGLSAAVYTQTTDVEIEVNGLLTYDRALVKPDAKQVTEANRKCYLPPPKVEVVVPTSEREPLEWRYALEAPPAGWEKLAFDDSSWKRGPGGFGTRGTPGAAVRTEWRTGEIWLRRTFELPANGSLDGIHLRIHHDEDAEVYLNGVLAARLTGYTTSYGLLPVSPEARAALKPGRNTVAVRCKQTGGGQYIDLGFAVVTEAGGTR
ncbi:MAG: beta galactosidase jelly roll domain-containing protein [Planctomycetes bacterium]|nr:beta galactosidase jelly roll domain-containing protein [Planctomycetota bacterium]